MAEVVRASLKTRGKELEPGLRVEGLRLLVVTLYERNGLGLSTKLQWAPRADPLHERSPANDSSHVNFTKGAALPSKRGGMSLASTVNLTEFFPPQPPLSTSQSTKQPELRFRSLLSSNSAQYARFKRLVVG